MINKKKIFLYQIFYDKTSRGLIEPGYIPLDNSLNERPDWYEFWVIRKFLRNSTLDKDSWYGFFSPKFKNKTGLNHQNVMNYILECEKKNDVIIFSHYCWDQIAYFQNPFFQGNFFHPGLLDLSQQFLDSLNINLKLNKMVTHSLSTVFGNFVVAKPNYWIKWLALADLFFDIVEQNKTEFANILNKKTSYGSKLVQAPIKTFIQERFPSIIFVKENLKISSLNLSENTPIYHRIFKENKLTRSLLQKCDSLKIKYCTTGKKKFLDMYNKTKKLIPINISV